MTIVVANSSQGDAAMARLGGRQKGTPNKVTAEFKNAVRIVYESIGGHAAFAQWAIENRTEFYRIASKLITTEVNVREENRQTVIIQRGVGQVIDAEPVPMLPHIEH